MSASDEPVAEPRSRPVVGVSRCLLGESVRYDGGSRHCPWITEILAQHFDFVPLCPEVEAGLGIPRPPIRLTQGPAGLELLPIDNPEQTCTAQLTTAAARLFTELTQVDGMILKARSPSCGVNDTPLFDAAGLEVGLGAGFFTRLCKERRPTLVIADEQMLASEAGRVSFMVQVLKHHFSTAS